MKFVFVLTASKGLCLTWVLQTGFRWALKVFTVWSASSVFDPAQINWAEIQIGDSAVSLAPVPGSCRLS